LKYAQHEVPAAVFKQQKAAPTKLCQINSITASNNHRYKERSACYRWSTLLIYNVWFSRV